MNIRKRLLPFKFLRNVWKEFKNMFYVKNSKSVLIVIPNYSFELCSFLSIINKYRSSTRKKKNRKIFTF